MRHEKIAITALAYIIGFTTAFIGYGIGPTLEVPDTMTASVITAATPIGDEDAAELLRDDVTVDAEGLYFGTGDAARLVSARTTNIDELGIGFHYNIASSAISPDGMMLYYCAEEDMSSLECHAYVYNSVTDTTYVVRGTTGEPVVLSYTNAAGEWSNDGVLAVSGMVSNNVATPWLIGNN